MCRSMREGGRRCRGGKCAVSRRERQRRYTARVRAAKKAAASQGGISALLGIPPLAELDGDFAGLLRGRDDDGSRAVLLREQLTIEEMEKSGRFAVLDTPLSEEDRTKIAAMSAEEIRGQLHALRDHLNTDLLVEKCHEYYFARRAEQAVRLIGDVTNTWVDAQIVEELSTAQQFFDTFDDEMSSLNARREAVKEGINSDDADIRMAAFAENSAISKEKASLSAACDTFAKYVSAARMTVFTELLDASVGSSKDFPVGELVGQKKIFKENLAAVTRLFPDTWKRRTEELDPLNIRFSEARAHYAARSPIEKHAYTAVQTDEAEMVEHDEPTWSSIPSKRRHGENVAARMGGNPDDPAHVRVMEAQCRNLENMDRMWMKENRRSVWLRYSGTPRWEVYTNPYGKLALRETFRRGNQVVGYESVIRVDKSRATLVHELAHRLEHGNPHLRAVCAQFIRRRTTDENGEQEAPTRYHKDKEPVYKDKLVHRYMGKMYDSRHTEVLSTGMEMMFFGRFGAGLGMGTEVSKDYREDPDRTGRLASDRDHLNLISGLLLSATKTPNLTRT
ncbi:MAG: hypothetical protein E6R04_06570 [Spirochaetes bacterium]|nr:MAG: hypothetical protein E6R04_06570 [Spirochaetota bacterium]